MFENMPFLVHIEMLSKITEYVWVELICLTLYSCLRACICKHMGETPFLSGRMMIKEKKR